VNHSSNTTVYRSTKFGLIASVALCGRGLCRASLRDRPAPDVVVLPAAPPDTVVVTRVEAPPAPVGAAVSICLSTGDRIDVLITSAGDTLVGPSRAPLSQLRPTVVLAGVYAADRAWFEGEEEIVLEQRSYARSGGVVRLDCGDIRRVGEYLGVPLFGTTNGSSAGISASGAVPETVYVPARPGEWQAYSSGPR